MTITHLSHFGLELSGQSGDIVCLTGTLANCKRMAFAHGLEVVKEEGRVLSMNCGVTVRDSARIATYWLTRGLIQIDPKGWCLALPLDLWLKAI